VTEAAFAHASTPAGAAVTASSSAADARIRQPRPTVSRGASLEELSEKIRVVESMDRRGRAFASIPTGWPAPFDRIERGVLHEWFSGEDRSPRSSRAWHAPLFVFAHLAQLAWDGTSTPGGALLVWIGRRVWPQPQVLMTAGAGRAAGPKRAATRRASPKDADRPALDRSLMIDPASDAERLWAIDLCLRSPAVAAVMADAGGMTLAHSRRLQLAAEHGGSLALLARGAWEMSTPSTAAMRWRVRPAPSPNTRPKWSIELRRCKGVRRLMGTEADAPILVLEHDRETGRLRVPADLADRPGPAATAC